MLGNLDAVRDWGFAKEYVEGMWRMLQQDEPDDFVLATGVGTTVREFCETAFEPRVSTGRSTSATTTRYERPTEVDALIADPSKAGDVLGWKAETHAEDLAQLMVDADLADIGAALHRSLMGNTAIVTGVGRSGRDVPLPTSRLAGLHRGRNCAAGGCAAAANVPSRHCARGPRCPRCRGLPLAADAVSSRTRSITSPPFPRWARPGNIRT